MLDDSDLTKCFTAPELPSNSSLSFRVLLYSRVSSTYQVRHGQSIEAQPEALRGFARAQGWIIVDEISDRGRTGRTADREGFRSLQSSLKRHRPDAVLVTRLSRFMRNARLTLNAVHELREMGVALICKDEPIDTRQRGLSDLFLAILATMAEWESDKLSEYAKETRKRLIDRGRLPSGRPPYGYVYDKVAGVLVIDEEKADVVRLIFSLYTDRRLGMQTIRRELAARAIPSPSGNKIWNSNTIAKLISDPTYVGRHRLGVKANAIIEDEVFERAQKLRKSNKHLHPPRKDPWPLQGRFKCSVCGSSLQCEYSRGHRYYRCPGRTVTSKYYLETGKRCTVTGLRANEVEEKLLAAICDAMLKPENFAAALEKAINEMRSNISDLERDTAPLEQALSDVNEELRRIERSWIRGRLPEDELLGLEKDAQARLERLQAQLDAVGTEDLEELERTRGLIRAAERSLEMADSAQDGWWSHPEAPPLWFTDVLVPPGWPSGESVQEELPAGCAYDTFPPIEPDHIAKTLTEALNRLQAEVWAGPGELQLKGTVDLTVPSSGDTCIPGVLFKTKDSQDSHALDNPSTSSPRTDRVHSARSS
ncbi:MAG: recombinase family protein [Chloroflexi bacterium]|nr:recombinase family protein [Chloroflexota bacterium]